MCMTYVFVFAKTTLHCNFQKLRKLWPRVGTKAERLAPQILWHRIRIVSFVTLSWTSSNKIPAKQENLA